MYFYDIHHLGRGIALYMGRSGRKMRQEQNILNREIADFGEMQELVGLEAVMTHSAFGHEYALMNLKDSSPFSEKAELLARMDQHKQVYFTARKKLEQMNPERLMRIEEDLRLQKEVFLRNSSVLH